MLGELSSDIMGTNPSQPSIVNHDWLTINTDTYDNYPSDNNSVRVLPKLSEMWDHKETGINLVPNTSVQPLRIRNSDESVSSVVCEAKKAMMAGIKGKALIEHLRSRFSTDAIILSKGELEKLSSEQGLLGNVYIDASAFGSSKELEQFLSQHKNRLAQDIVISKGKINPLVINLVASKFRKNVVASINYNDELYKKYKNHLVAIGKIDKDFVIDSKESLRLAFLSNPVVEEKIVETKVEKSASKEELDKEILNRYQRMAYINKVAEEEMHYNKIYPILEYTRQFMAKGKMGKDLREIIEKRFAKNDLRSASKYLSYVVSDRISSENINNFIVENGFSDNIAESLKKLGSNYPVKKQEFKDAKSSERPIGVQGYFHVVSGKKFSMNELEIYRRSSVEALKSGLTIEAVKDDLLQKLSEEESNKVLSAAIEDLNNAFMTSKANVYVKALKQKVVADLEERSTLPDPESIVSKTKEIQSFYEGMSLNVDVNPLYEKNQLVDIKNVGVDSLQL